MLIITLPEVGIRSITLLPQQWINVEHKVSSIHTKNDPKQYNNREVDREVVEEDYNLLTT
jgi:hypothetical protein